MRLIANSKKVDAISVDPGVVDKRREQPYLTPKLFKERIPVSFKRMMLLETNTCSIVLSTHLVMLITIS